MIMWLRDTRFGKLFLFTLIFLVFTDLVVFFNVPILRPVLGFVFLTFVPGLLILHILKLNKLGLVEKIILSVGLSISFLMLFGFIANSVSLALGYRAPLSFFFLLVLFSGAAFVLAVVALIRNRNVPLSFSNPRLTTKEKLLLILPSLFPLLSIAGMYIMNLTANNALLMFLLFLIPAYVIFILFYRKKVPARLYPGLIYLTGISLILMVSLRSNHILGSDIHLAYYTFQTTLDNQSWSVAAPTLVDTLLSVSLLPSVYHIFLNINQEYLFKILFALLFSIAPLAIYIISRKYIGDFYAFIASFFYMSQFYFLWATSSAQTSMSILFFTLIIMVLVHDDINELAKRILFIILAAANIMSHYSSAYIFLSLLFLTWLGMQIIPLIILRKRKAVASSGNPGVGHNPHSLVSDKVPLSNVATTNSRATRVTRTWLKRGVTLSIVQLFFIMFFFWYAQVTVSAFGAGVDFIQHTLMSLNEWFLLESKGPEVAAAVGQIDLPTIPQQIKLVFSWITVSFVALGVLSTMVRYKRTVALPGSAHSAPGFLQSKFDIEYFVLTLACSAVLVLVVVLPYVTKGYNMGRIYFQTMAVLAPFFVIGGIMVAKWLRARPHWVVLLVLIPFFMSTTGTMSQIFRVPASVTLNSAGAEYKVLYVHEQESRAAKWLKGYGWEGMDLYTTVGRRMLVSQAGITERQNKLLDSRHQESESPEGYIYLGYEDIAVDGAVTRHPDIFVDKSKIYASGGAEIYR